ncbi:6-phosphogluconate dehydrogenase [Paenibacillus apiarius]|uniref:6-phosphogluconate dehydrogenase n=1 Tax=Paenibacillus apiarius TaxID=46240 RepID=A0ABT4E1Q8_9BACL|nr:6-phosphogluconate dehydrogenase [Paenibacillus apiarius]MCY9516940.1 6-phosphogluconate dehydrogenase [Paenibacillus apiarius]MCY9523526.1 6-phosphogluconate dehydrogenase [Paenibacillus apiarius]MCY9554829.1 6-phosphogluconate dehydrogenase [Paenibacillus apiarius]MCY9561312.1 6-phosphogluconate dehydrogenase [Paenibacillus apiarius]MCY9686971.1 6-phosphogluconate dehydrogenase [Paenibacillus apiarius]
MKVQIKYPTRTKEVMAVSVLFSAAMLQVAMMAERTFPVLFFMQAAVLGILVASLLIEAYVRFGKRTLEIREGSDTITVNGTQLDASQIEMIKVKGFKNAAFGLQLKGKKAIPIKCCFKFVDAKHTQELLKWAERNQIQVINTHFMTWV